MKEQILKLCRRLDKFTVDDIVLISELEEAEVLAILQEFVSGGKLVETEGQYRFCRQVSAIQKYSIFAYYPSSVVDIVIRCFCSGIPAYIAFRIANIGENEAHKFYNIFRNTLYERQTKKLKTLYVQKPQIARNRMFFNKELHFYIYDNQVFVSEELLESENDKSFSKEEVKEFKKIYSYLTRCAFHNQAKHNLPQKLNEFLWRRNKDFEPLYFELKTAIA